MQVERGERMKNSNEAMEIEQLKDKIENYRKALSSLKTENYVDAHLKRRVRTLEEKIENLNEQVQELAKLLDEGIAFLANEFKELAEQWNKQHIDKKETVKPRIDSARFQQTEPPPNSKLQQLDTQTNNQQGSLLSFRQLKQLAQHPPVQTNESTKYNSPRYYAPAVPIETSVLREPEPIVYEKKNPPSRVEPVVYEEKKPPSRVEPVDTSIGHFSGQTSQAQQEREEPQPIQPVTQFYGGDENEASSFWKFFKKK